MKHEAISWGVMDAMDYSLCTDLCEHRNTAEYKARRLDSLFREERFIAVRVVCVYDDGTEETEIDHLRARVAKLEAELAEALRAKEVGDEG